MHRKEYMKKYNREYGQSYKGLVKRIFNHQLRNCLQRNHTPPSYTEEELYEWYVGDTAHLQLHEAWKQSNFDRELVPSIDRLDNDKSYSLDNIELVTWAENKRRAYKAIRANTLKNPTLLQGGHKPVVQYDVNKTKVGEFISITAAERATGIDHRPISDACLGKRKSTGGFLWAYAHEEQKILDMSTQQVQKILNRAASSAGFIGTVHYTDGTTFVGDVMEIAKHLNTSAHNVRNLLKGITSNRSPLFPDISHFTLEYK